MSEVWRPSASQNPINMGCAVRADSRTDQLLVLLLSDGAKGLGMARPSDGGGEKPLPWLRIQMDQERNTAARAEQPSFTMRFGSLPIL
jgi:hypothetical protein